MKKAKLFVPDYIGYANPFLGLFDLTTNVGDADVVMFTGGADIDPAFYGETRGRYTNRPTTRDTREKELFDLSYRLGKKFLGICRGAQLLCALAGGKVIQHVDNHDGGFQHFHRMTTVDNDLYDVNSLHHQMMFPWSAPNYQILAWATKNLSPKYLNGDNEEIPDIHLEPEVCYFDNIKALGIQCHPEHGFPPNHPTLRYFNKLVKERLL